MVPNQEEETGLHSQGFALVAGLDEVGRGALAGPVVAAAVILPDLGEMANENISLIRDSKQLSPKGRERANALIAEIAVGTGIGMAGNDEIDNNGIASATRLAMGRALDELMPRPDHLLIDAMPLAWRNVPYKAIVGGDRLATVIAAASIVAKVYRDALMIVLDKEYPGYGLASHKGYSTEAHRSAIFALGASPIHRLTFSPLKPMLPL